MIVWTSAHCDLFSFQSPAPFSNKPVKFCKQGGMEKALLVSDHLHTWGPEFASQNPRQKPSAVACARHPSNGRMEGRDRLLPGYSQARNASWLAKFQADERPRLKQNMEDTWKEQLLRLSSDHHVYKLTCVPLHTWRRTDTQFTRDSPSSPAPKPEDNITHNKCQFLGKFWRGTNNWLRTELPEFLKEHLSLKTLSSCGGGRGWVVEHLHTSEGAAT